MNIFWLMVSVFLKIKHSKKREMGSSPLLTGCVVCCKGITFRPLRIEYLVALYRVMNRARRNEENTFYYIHRNPLKAAVKGTLLIR